MQLWYLHNLERLDREQSEIAQVAENAEWLHDSSWLFDGASLCLDAVIRAHDYDYPIRLTYPDYFPSSPPIVVPRNAEGRWSGHQYGDAGPLCLEWGPDTWRPEVTGVQVLESAYHLLSIENPLGQHREETVAVAPSRHQLTPGQELRNSRGRYYVSPNLHAQFSRLPSNTSGIIKFSIHNRPSSWLGLVHQIQPIGAETPWSDESIPAAMKGSQGDESLSAGVFYKTSLDSHTIERVSKLDALAAVLQGAGYQAEFLTNSALPNHFGLSEQPDAVVVIDEAGSPHFFWILGDMAWHWPPIFSENTDHDERQPTNLSDLTHKKVGIVGLGSAGSKVAESLARMGVGRFYLVDHDLFLPENAIRHALDWRNVAEHKVDGVQDLLRRISPSVEVTVSRFHLTGQESTAWMDGVLSSLGACDILIDTTANPRVFNLLSHVAPAEEKPLLWLEIYGGGMGGMIARSRPGQDPPPQIMRAVYNDYCLANPAPAEVAVANYTSEDDDGQVMVASDADVSIIGHHLARFAADTVLGRQEYPHSLYLIGLARWWVFEAPFDTIPIRTDQLARAMPDAEQDAEARQRGIQFLKDLLSKRANGTDTTN